MVSFNIPFDITNGTINIKSIPNSTTSSTNPGYCEYCSNTTKFQYVFHEQINTCPFYKEKEKINSTIKCPHCNHNISISINKEE